MAGGWCSGGHLGCRRGRHPCRPEGNVASLRLCGNLPASGILEPFYPPVWKPGSTSGRRPDATTGGKESVGADGDAAPLMMKNLPANCRRRRQKISGQLFNRMLDAIAPDPFKKIIKPGRFEKVQPKWHRNQPFHFGMANLQAGRK
jgi:hypothetical protein